VQDYQFYIFDRWGEIIFKSTKPFEGWDGTHKGIKCKEDVYVWKLVVKSALSMDKYERKGHVSLMR
jgi:gliding motility-associated-like protein